LSTGRVIGATDGVIGATGGVIGATGGVIGASGGFVVAKIWVDCSQRRCRRGTIATNRNDSWRRRTSTTAHQERCVTHRLSLDGRRRSWRCRGRSDLTGRRIPRSRRPIQRSRLWGLSREPTCSADPSSLIPKGPRRRVERTLGAIMRSVSIVRRVDAASDLSDRGPETPVLDSKPRPKHLERRASSGESTGERIDTPVGDWRKSLYTGPSRRSTTMSPCSSA